MKDLVLSEEAFDRFLHWLHPNREEAARKYEAVRRRLVIFFNCRGCPVSEDLADRTINRVIGQMPALGSSYDGDPAKYFHGVAHYVHLEYLRERSKTDAEPVPDDWPDPRRPEEAEEKELVADCLEHCLQKLPPKKREMLVLYYKVEKQTSLEYREELARRFELSVNALRLQIMRLRDESRACITGCLQRGQAR